MNTANPNLLSAGTGNASKTQASVFDVGAGFVNPYRAIVENADTFITVLDDIPGSSAATPIKKQMLSSLNFGMIPKTSVETRSLEVTMHNTSSEKKTYTFRDENNDNTQFSYSATSAGAKLAYSADSVTVPPGKTGRVFVRVSFEALPASGFLEGRMFVSDEDTEYVLPWTTGIGEAAAVFNFNNAILDKPILTTNQPGGRAAGAYNSPYSCQAGVFINYTGTWSGGSIDFLILDENNLPLAFTENTVSGAPSGDGPDDYKFFSAILNGRWLPLNEDGSTKEAAAMPEGVYRLGVVDESYIYTSNMAFIVSNAIPEITPDGWNEAAAGTDGAAVHFRGTIKSGAVETAMAKGFIDEYTGEAISGTFNAVCIIGPDGTETRSYCDAFGKFDIALQVPPDASDAPNTAITKAFAIDFAAWAYHADQDSIGMIRIANNKSETVTLRCKKS